MLQRVSCWLAAASLVLTTGLVHARISPDSLAERDADAFVPKPQFAKAVSLGFNAVLADFYWLQAVQVIGGEEADPAQYGTHLGRLIDVVTTLNPWVDHPYRFAAVWLTGSPEDVRQANRLLRRSLDYHPWEWRNRFYLGYNHFFYLNEHEAAAAALESAAQLPGSPRYLPRLVARLQSEASDIETAVVFLQQLLEDAPDDATRAQYRAALDEIEVEHKARLLDRARHAYEKLSGRTVESAEELGRGEFQVLDQIPSPWPSSLPPSMHAGIRWELEDGRFVSSYYGHRYEVNRAVMEQGDEERWKDSEDESRRETSDNS